MGHLGLHNPGDLVHQPNNLFLKVGIPPTGAFGTLTVESLTVTSGASLPPFTALVVVPTGTSELATVTDGLWNGSGIEEIYGGTGQSSYNPGDILFADSVDSLATLPSGAEGTHLQIAGGAIAWVPHTAPLGNVIIATTPTVNLVNADRYVMVSGVGLVTVNLPGGPVVGQRHDVKDRQGIAASSGITVDGNGAEIDGAASAAIGTDYGFLSVLWDGAQWNLL